MEAEHVFFRQPIRVFFLSGAIFALASTVGHPSTSLLAAEGRATPGDVADRVGSASGQNGGPGGPVTPDPVLADPAIDIDGGVIACVNDADCAAPPGPNTSVCRAGLCYARKGRFVSVAMNPFNAGALTARRVCVDAPGPGAHCRWVDAPGPPITHLGPGPQPLLTANLVDTSVYRDWSADPVDSHGNIVVHIGGCPVSNGHDYYIQAILQGSNEADEASYSPALILPTQDAFGDVDGGSTTSIGDVFHLIRGFQNQQELPRTWLKIIPSGDNPADPGDIPLAEAFGALQGFQGQTYEDQPGGGPPSNCGPGGPGECQIVANPPVLIQLVPVKASGVEGTDWVAGPGPNDITLMHGGQDVAVEVFIENLGANNVAGYQVALDCNYTSSVSGGIDPYSAECPIAGLPFDSGQCLGVDGDRPDWILGSSTITIIACQTTATCPDGVSGKFICGAVGIGVPGSGPGSFYGATFGFAVSADAEGVAVVGVDLEPNETFMADIEGCVFLLENVTPANIITQAGQCVCDADVGPCPGPDGIVNINGDISLLIQCVLERADPCGGPLERCDVNCDGLVDFADVGVAILQFQNHPDACDVPVGACCALIQGRSHCIETQEVGCGFMGGAYEGDGTLCPIPISEQCVVNADCDDCQSCTVDVCDNGTCTHNPDAALCCNPITGIRTLIDDENLCTDDACDPSTGLVTHVGSATEGVCADPQGSRYITVTPPCGLSGTCDDTSLVAMSLAVEVEPGVTIDLGFIQPDGSLGETEVFDTPSNWGTVEISGGFIRPSTTYIVTLVPMTGLAGGSSSSTTTGVYADMDGNGIVNIADIQIVVFVFLGDPRFVDLFADMNPCVPNHVVNFADILAAKLAFEAGPVQDWGFSNVCPLGVCCFFPDTNPNSCGPFNDFGPGAFREECPDPDNWTEAGECGPDGECPQ